MQTALRDLLANKYIICSCEGVAEKTIIDLLIDNGRLCFSRDDLVDNECTTLRKAALIADEFLHRDYERDVVILRILDNANEAFKMPKLYQNVCCYSVVTKPEIEYLHIIAFGLEKKFENACKQQKQKFKASSFCKSYLSKDIKSETAVKALYADDLDKLVTAINRYHQITQHKTYCLYDLLKKPARRD